MKLCQMKLFTVRDYFNQDFISFLDYVAPWKHNYEIYSVNVIRVPFFYSITYPDSDYVGCKMDQRSICRTCQFLELIDTTNEVWVHGGPRMFCPTTLDEVSLKWFWMPSFKSHIYHKENIIYEPRGSIREGRGALGLVCGFPFVSVLCRSLSASAGTYAWKNG